MPASGADAKPTRVEVGHPWLARTMDFVMRPLYPARRLVVPEARGRVLEVGVGTGLNLGLYREVESLDAVDPDPFMIERAAPRIEALPFPARLHRAGAEALPFADASFDSAVLTFVLCTIPQTGAALAEVRRVLAPGGRLFFVEHTRSVQSLVAGVQTALTPLWKKIGGGCHLNRPALELIAGAGFHVSHAEPVWGERWTLFPVYRGVAEAAA